MPVAFGALKLTHDAFFDLTPFQFLQLHRGWVERERARVIKHTEILLMVRNVNRGEDDKALKLGDILPWYDDYVGEDHEEPVKERFIDTRIPQADRVRTRILESKHLDPETLEHTHPEWIEANRIANLICDAQKEQLKDVIRTKEGVIIRKADPKEWGEAFPDW